MNIVIINGWGQNEEIWAGFLTQWSTAKAPKIINVDKSQSLEQWLEEIDAHIQAPTLMVGWSLGGVLATHYAACNPSKLLGLVTLNCNPKFVASSDWQFGMPEVQFAEFLALAEQGDVKTLVKLFSFLMVQGCQHKREDLKQLKGLCTADSLPSLSVMVSGLALLGQLDSRNVLAELDIPILHILGAKDALVSPDVANHLKQNYSSHRVMLLEGLGHVPLLSMAPAVIEVLDNFILHSTSAISPLSAVEVNHA